MNAIFIGLMVLNFALIVVPRALERRRRRAVRRGVAPIAAVKQGDKVSIMGSVVARAPLRTSPILQRPCVGYRVVVECKEYWSVPSVQTVVDEEAFDSFVLADGTGQALLHAPFDIKLEPTNRNLSGGNDLPPALIEMLEQHGVPVPAVHGDPRTFECVETVLMPGDQIIASGYATFDVDPGGRSSHRDPPVICHLNGSADEPVVITEA